MAVYYTVTYNGYSFEHVKLNWSEQSVYAADNMTYVGTSYKFTVSGTVAKTSQADFYDTLQSMRCALRTPRQDFKVVWDSDEEGNQDQEIIAISSAENSVNTGYFSDIAWGPLPSTLTVNEFISGRAANYSWTLSTQTKECFTLSCDSFQAISPILSLTAKWTHSIDPTGLTTRTVSGTLLLDSAQVDLYQTAADSYRSWVLPSLPSGFKPDRQDYSQSEDGRTLTFSCTQIEKYFTLPYPIVDGQVSMGTHYESYGGIVIFTFSGYFCVAKNSPGGKQDILNTIANLINSKLSQFPTIIPTQTEIKDDIYSGRMDFTLSYQIPYTIPQGTDDLSKVKESPGNNVYGTTPPGSNGTSMVIGPYGWISDGGTGSGVIATVPSPLDNCTEIATQLGNSAVAVPPPGQGVAGGSGNGNGQGSGTLPNDTSAANQANPYFAYHEEVSFHTNNGYVVFHPKSILGSGILVQQTHQPTLIITQAGYCSQATSDNSYGPTPAPPFYGPADNAWILISEINPESPIPIGTGSYNQMTVNWRYVIAVEGPFESNSDLGIAYPKDPRRIAAGGSLADPYGGNDVGVPVNIPDYYDLVDGV